jgi:adenosylcobinamide-phosphate synthase
MAWLSPDIPHTLSLLFILPAAMALDALVGDPQRLPHPVRWMGWAIAKGEPLFRRLPGPGKMAGALFSLILILTFWIMAFLLLCWSYGIHPLLGAGVEIVMLFYCLSARSLGRAAMEIFELLHRRDVSAARARLALIVGRDVTRYEADDIARATVETVAENFVDGVLSPLFYAALGGAPLAVAYKMVNTLDSMIGYKTPRYMDFGWAAARIDDIANYIPARLSVPLIALAARLLCPQCGGRALRTARTEGSRHSSPNAGYPEAAFAGALEIRMGGPNVYHGIMVHKPYIGSAFGTTRTKHIKKACQLMLLTTLMAGLGAWCLILFHNLWVRI